MGIKNKFNEFVQKQKEKNKQWRKDVASGKVGYYDSNLKLKDRLGKIKWPF